MLRDIPSVVGCLFDAVHVSILAIDHKVVIANMVPVPQHVRPAKTR